MDVRNTNSSLENTVQLSLVEQLRMLGSHRFQFNCNFLICADVCAVVDISEGAAAKLAGQSVFSSDSQFHFMLKFVLNFSQCSV